MFDDLLKMKGMMGSIQRMLQDENFRKLMSNPKIQALLMDPEFQQVVQSKDYAKMVSHPKFSHLMQDPEIKEAFSKMNPESFSKGKTS